MKKIILAAIAAVAINNTLIAAPVVMDLDTFVNQMENTLKKPKEDNRIESFTGSTETVKDAENLKFMNGGLCDSIKPGKPKSEFNSLYPLGRAVLTLASPEQQRNRLFVYQMESVITKAQITKLIADVLEEKAKKRIVMKGVNLSTANAEKFIQKQIDGEQVKDHYHICQFSCKDYGTKDFFVNAYKYLNAFDFKAKNGKELGDEILRRNVALRVYFADLHRFKHDGVKIIRVTSFENGLAFDHCGLNMDQIGLEDMSSPLLLTKLLKDIDAKGHNGFSDGLSLENFLLSLYDAKFDGLTDALLDHKELKWNTDKPSDKEEMFNQIMEDLKNRKVLK